MKDEEPSEFAEAVGDEMTEIWLSRFPRIDERGLRDRLMQALLPTMGFPPGAKSTTADDLDDAEVIAAALVEHIHVLKRMKEGLATGELVDVFNDALKRIGQA